MKVTITILSALTILMAVAAIPQQQTVQATGCPVETIIPFIDDAISSFNSGDYAKALSQMQDARNELSDTFEIEE